MKINEVITEALNTSTGTPNPTSTFGKVGRSVGRELKGWGRAIGNVAKDYAGIDRDDSVPATPAEIRANKLAIDSQADAQASGQFSPNPKRSTPADVVQPIIPAQGTIITINANGMDYFKGANGAWFEKPDSRPGHFTASGALQIKDPIKTSALEKIALKDHQVVYVKPESPGDNVNFMLDPVAQRRAIKLSSTRQARQNR